MSAQNNSPNEKGDKKKLISAYLDKSDIESLIELEKETGIGFQTHIRLSIKQYLRHNKQ